MLLIGVITIFIIWCITIIIIGLSQKDYKYELREWEKDRRLTMEAGEKLDAPEIPVNRLMQAHQERVFLNNINGTHLCRPILFILLSLWCMLVLKYEPMDTRKLLQDLISIISLIICCRYCFEVLLYFFTKPYISDDFKQLIISQDETTSFSNDRRYSPIEIKQYNKIYSQHPISNTLYYKIMPMVMYISLLLSIILVYSSY